MVRLRAEVAAHPYRRTDLVETHIGNEVLLYDGETHRAYRLNDSAALVWHRCNGQTPVGDIVESGGAARNVLARLAADELVFNVPADISRRPMTRSGFVLRAGATIAAGSVVVPVIESILVPTPAAAESVDGGTGDGGDGDGGPPAGKPPGGKPPKHH